MDDDMPVHVLSRAAAVAEEYGWRTLAVELRHRVEILAHQTGPLWHQHRLDGQVLRHAHDGGDLDHRYFDHPEDR